jgi:hypothetical protein
MRGRDGIPVPDVRRPPVCRPDENRIVVDVWMLEPGEDLIVARRLREVLAKAAG